MRGKGIPRTDGTNDLSKVKLGDVAIFDWGENGASRDHVMTVSRIDQTPNGPKIYFVSHNLDGLEREMMRTMFTEHRNSRVWFYHIP